MKPPVSEENRSGFHAWLADPRAARILKLLVVLQVGVALGAVALFFLAPSAWRRHPLFPAGLIIGVALFNLAWNSVFNRLFDQRRWTDDAHSRRKKDH